jgi:hypothetical protein
MWRALRCRRPRQFSTGQHRRHIAMTLPAFMTWFGPRPGSGCASPAPRQGLPRVKDPTGVVSGTRYSAVRPFGSSRRPARAETEVALRPRPNDLVPKGAARRCRVDSRAPGRPASAPPGAPGRANSTVEGLHFPARCARSAPRIDAP